MNFEGYLYDIVDLSGEDGTLTCRIRLRPESPIYSGHFPGAPITPGVALLTIVRELIERRLNSSATGSSAASGSSKTSGPSAASGSEQAAVSDGPVSAGHPLRLTEVIDAKFLRPLTPDLSPVTVTVRDLGDGTIKSEISTSAALHARMRLAYNK